MSDTRSNGLSGPSSTEVQIIFTTFSCGCNICLRVLFILVMHCITCLIDFDTLVKVYIIDWDKPTQRATTGCVPIGGGIGALASDI